jgi:hypothetical protein
VRHASTRRGDGPEVSLPCWRLSPQMNGTSLATGRRTAGRASQKSSTMPRPPLPHDRSVHGSRSPMRTPSAGSSPPPDRTGSTSRSSSQRRAGCAAARCSGFAGRTSTSTAGSLRISSALQPVGDELVLVDPKTSRARRPIELPEGTMAMLRRLRRDQAERRLLLGEAWHDLGVVVERGDGRPIHPDVYSRRYARLVQRLGLPPSACTTFDMHTRPDRSRRACIRRSLRICSAMRPRASRWTPTRMSSHHSGRVPLRSSRPRSVARSEVNGRDVAARADQRTFPLAFCRRNCR